MSANTVAWIGCFCFVIGVFTGALLTGGMK